MPPERRKRRGGACGDPWALLQTQFRVAPGVAGHQETSLASHGGSHRGAGLALGPPDPN